MLNNKHFKLNNINIFNIDKYEILNYLEKNNIKPNIVFTKLPKITIENEEEGIGLNLLLTKLDNEKSNNFLNKLYSVVDKECHIYVFTDTEKIYEDLKIMQKYNFILKNILVYKKNKRSPRVRYHRDNIEFVLFFVVKNNSFNIRGVNKYTMLSEETFIENGTPKEIFKILIHRSKRNLESDTFILNLEYPQYNLLYNCIGKGLFIYSNVLNTIEFNDFKIKLEKDLQKLISKNLYKNKETNNNTTNDKESMNLSVKKSLLRRKLKEYRREKKKL